MPSDIQAIAQCVCVGCGRGPDQVALKKLYTYSRTFSCLQCFLKYSNCAHCQHERHASVDIQTVRGFDVLANPLAIAKRTGACPCGCTEYRHGLEAEWDRQFEAHVGKAPTSRLCLRGCGRLAHPKTPGAPILFCEICEREWAELQQRAAN